MRVLAALTLVSTIATATRAFAPPSRSINNARPTATALNIFGTGSGNANASIKKKLDNMKKKQKFSVLIISSAAKDSVKAKQLLDQKGVKYTAVELDKEGDNDEAIRAEFGLGSKPSVSATWIRGKLIGGYSELNTLNTKGELDGMLTNVPKTTHISPI